MGKWSSLKNHNKLSLLPATLQGNANEQISVFWDKTMMVDSRRVSQVWEKHGTTSAS